MNSEIGNKAAGATEIAIRESTNRNVSWKVEDKDGIESSIGCVQLSSDKYHSSMSAGTTVFHPLYVTLLNFSKKTQRKHIMSSSTVCVYLSVELEKARSCDNITLNERSCRNINNEHVSGSNLLWALYESVEFILKLLPDRALMSSECKTED